LIRSGPLAGETIESFGQQVLQAGAGLETRNPDDIVNTDLKLYEAGGMNFAIAQVEVTDLIQLEDHLEDLRTALDTLRQRRGLNFAILMVTDVVGNASRLVIVNPPPVLYDLPYPRQANNTYMASGLVSRKKQLLPTILGLLEA
jgi:manganese-dependent inorganic pyrophosphatase